MNDVAPLARPMPPVARADENRFADVLALIEAARARVYQVVNAELVALYWQLGESSPKQAHTA